MLVDKYMHVWKACSPYEDRPTLQHVSVVRHEAKLAGLKPPNNAVAYATDGFILVAVPVELQDEEEPGFIQGKIFELAQKDSLYPPDKTRAWIRLGEVDEKLGTEIVRFVDQSTMPRTTFGGTKDSHPTFPDFSHIMPRLKRLATSHAVKEERGLFSFNPAKLKQACEAMGFRFVKKATYDDTARCFVYNWKQSDAYLVTLDPVESLDNDKLPLPYALLMPLHNFSKDRLANAIRDERFRLERVAAEEIEARHAQPA